MEHTLLSLSPVLLCHLLKLQSADNLIKITKEFCGKYIQIELKIGRLMRGKYSWLRYQLGGIWGRPRANKCKLDETCECKAGNGELEILPQIRVCQD